MPVPFASAVLRLLLGVALAGGLAGCASLGYYAQLARGQMELLSRREPIAGLIADETRDAQLRRRLALVLDARRFAVTDLHLPDNASYTLYADLGRAYAVWNVLVTPEFSLAPVESCFPLVGCLAYRGHYRREHAERQAAQFRAQGHDVAISGIAAYSTLGWFDDPVLNTMLHWSDAVLVATVFHELAHQALYVPDDTVFNESMARFVERQGLREFFFAGHIGEAASHADHRRQDAFVRLLLDARRELEALYAQPLPETEMRARKAAAFARLKSGYAHLRDTQWHGDRAYDAWFDRDLNNAHLLGVGLYDEFVPAFERLYALVGRDWPRFYAACADLGRLDPGTRRARLRQWMGLASTAS